MKTIEFRWPWAKKELFWKFISKDHCSLGDFGQLHYKVGKVLSVPNADLNPHIQCERGIHCLAFPSGEKVKYDRHNVLFGPKVAILSVHPKDIIYHSPNGKCRVKKARVVEIKEPKNWMITGNDCPKWAYNYAVSAKKHVPEVYNCLLNNSDGELIFGYANYILKNHDPLLLRRLVLLQDWKNLGIYQRYVYNDPTIPTIILENKLCSIAKDYIFNELYYKRQTFKELEVLFNMLIEQDAFDHLNYLIDYYPNILPHKKLYEKILSADPVKVARIASTYAYRNGHDEKLMDVVIKSGWAYLAYNYAFYILKSQHPDLYAVCCKDSYYRSKYEREFK